MVKICKCVGKKNVVGSNSNGPFRFTVGHFVSEPEGDEGSEVFSSAIPLYLDPVIRVGASYACNFEFRAPSKPVKSPRLLFAVEVS